MSQRPCGRRATRSMARRAFGEPSIPITIRRISRTGRRTTSTGPNARSTTSRDTLDKQSAERSVPRQPTTITSARNRRASLRMPSAGRASMFTTSASGQRRAIARRAVSARRSKVCANARRTPGDWLPSDRVGDTDDAAYAGDARPRTLPAPTQVRVRRNEYPESRSVYQPITFHAQSPLLRPAASARRSPARLTHFSSSTATNTRDEDADSNEKFPGRQRLRDEDDIQCRQVDDCELERHR